MHKTIVLGQVRMGAVRWLLKVIVALRPDWLGRPEFSASGLILSLKKGLVVNEGQCMEQIRRLIPGNGRFRRIYRLWRLYHHNASRPGTREQREAVEQYRKRKPECEYEDVCSYLKLVGLYEVDYQGRPFRYGSRALYEPIPKSDLREMMRLVGMKPLARAL